MRPTILVIDDSKAVRIIVKKALAGLDCVVNEATNGFTGLYAIERAMPDLLLLDVRMPTMDGLEMLGMMKGHERLKTIPVIMLTSTTDHKVLPAIRDLGVHAMIAKPFSEEAIRDAVLGAPGIAPAKK